jgi:uncharacterized tellurite resistance protein B-like protein
VPGQAFLKDLAKLVVAAAWADGEISNVEMNTLKDLLFRMPDLTGEEYAELEVFLVHPVRPEEREQLLERVLAGVRTANDRRLVLRTLTDMVEADGRVTEQEKALLDTVKQALDRQGTGLLSTLGRMIRGAVAEKATGPGGGGREARLDDYIRNTVYFELSARMQQQGCAVRVAEDRLRKLCLAAGLMGKVAWVDAEVSDHEKQAMQEQLGRGWDLDQDEARLVAEMSLSRVMKGLDHFRVCRGFFESTTPAERKDFLRCLFRIANSCGRTSHAEILEIQRIANSIKVPHADFIEAKLTIPSEQRGGL